jgi:hypothetical protein
VQKRDNYAWFCACTNPCIFAVHTPSNFLEGKVSGRDFQYVDHAVASHPGGTIPAWIINAAQKEETPNLLKAMRQRVGKNATK